MLNNQVWKLVSEHRSMAVTLITVSLCIPGLCRGKAAHNRFYSFTILDLTSICASDT